MTVSSGWYFFPLSLAECKANLVRPGDSPQLPYLQEGLLLNSESPLHVRAWEAVQYPDSARHPNRKIIRMGVTACTSSGGTIS